MPLQGSSVALLAYVDDLVLMDKLRSLYGRLEEAAKMVGLQINDDKCMVVGRTDSTRMYPSLIRVAIMISIESNNLNI